MMWAVGLQKERLEYWQSQDDVTLLKHCFPHADFGTAQQFDLLSFIGLRHGDVVEHIKKVNGEGGKKERFTFRLIERDMEPEYVAAALPVAKKYWNKEEGKFDEHHRQD